MALGWKDESERIRYRVKELKHRMEEDANELNKAEQLQAWVQEVKQQKTSARSVYEQFTYLEAA